MRVNYFIAIDNISSTSGNMTHPAQVGENPPHIKEICRLDMDLMSKPFFKRPLTLHDRLPWSIIDMFPKVAGGTDIKIIGANPFRLRNFAAWFVPPRSVFPHTKRYRIQRAICEEDINEVKAVLDSGFDPDKEVLDEKYAFNSMSLAARLNRTAILEYLILRGADINIQDPSGNTPLMHAITNWQFEAIKLLAENGARIDIKDIYGFDAFDKAKHRGLNTIVEYLKTLKNNNKDSIRNLPKFNIEFDFEKKLFASNADSLVFEKKFYKSQPAVYPFNNLSGTYVTQLLDWEIFEPAKASAKKEK